MNTCLSRWTPAVLIILAGSTHTLAAGSFPPSLNLSSLDGTNGFVLYGIDADDYSGWSVSCAGDVNADGVDDVIIGAQGADPNGQSAAGESYVVFGAVGVGAGGSLDLSTLNGTNGFVLNGIDARNAGRSVSCAGDVNGDGVDDLIIGAPGAAGESYVVFGAVGVGAGGSLDLATLNGTNGFVVSGIDGTGPGDRSGISVSFAGDVNNDGVDDLIIGADFASPGGSDRAGESYVVFGRDTATQGNFPAALELSALDGTNGFVLYGIDSYDYSGRSVSSAGDVNGDGVDDVVIGAWGADPNGQSAAGESYVVFGAVGVGAGGSLDLSTLNGTNGFVVSGIDGTGLGDRSGESVSSAGDVNGDGVGDLIIASRLADPGGASYAGESYVVFGSVGVGAGGSLDLATLDGTNGFVLNGIDAQDNSGVSVSSAGDVNGDGADDVVIGASPADPNAQSAAGESYVVFGAVGVGAGGSLDLSTLNGTNGFVLNGIDAEDFSGFSVSSAGDVNNDGVDDIIIGAWAADPGGADRAGESYVVFGCPTIPPPVCVGDIDGDNDTDVFDFGILATFFGQSVTPGTFGDLDGSGFVTVFDFGILAGDFGCPE